MRHALLALAVLALTAGCASSYAQGQSSLRQGRYVEAEGYFNQALATDPGRTDAVVGLGVSQYKQGEFDQAIDTLQKAVLVRPNEPSVRLYLGLAYLQTRDTAQAEQQLTALRSLRIDPRLGVQIDHALTVLRQGPIDEPVRVFLVGSLETQADLSREVQEARLQAQLAQTYSYAYYPFGFFPYYGFGYPYFGPPYAPCVLVRRGAFPYCI